MKKVRAADNQETRSPQLWILTRHSATITKSQLYRCIILQIGQHQISSATSKMVEVQSVLARFFHIKEKDLFLHSCTPHTATTSEDALIIYLCVQTRAIYVHFPGSSENPCPWLSGHTPPLWNFPWQPSLHHSVHDPPAHKRENLAVWVATPVTLTQPLRLEVRNAQKHTHKVSKNLLRKWISIYFPLPDYRFTDKLYTD